MKAGHFFWITLSLVLSLSQLSFAQQRYQTRALNAHNYYRGRHQAPPLEMDNGLNAIATQCAQYYLQRRSIDHSCPYKGDLGESLFQAVGQRWNGDQMAEHAVKSFYREESNYDYANPGNSRNGESFLRFTAMLWRGSEQLGFGVARTRGYAVAVALYSPHGNVEGTFAENV